MDFVVARKLAEAGRATRVLLLADPKELRGDAVVMFEHMKLTPSVATTVAGLGLPEASEIFASDLLVDAMLGTGFHPPVSELYAAAIAKINTSAHRLIYQNGSRGRHSFRRRCRCQEKPLTGTIARADAVVTFTAPRPAHIFAGLTNGPTVVAPIGSPDKPSPPS